MPYRRLFFELISPFWLWEDPENVFEILADAHEFAVVNHA
jgi:hypothetical protein